MVTLTVWKFNTSHGADDALKGLAGLHNELFISLDNAAVVSWEEEDNKPSARELHSTIQAGMLTSGFWGLLCGMIFSVTQTGQAAGALTAAGSAWLGWLRDVGISDAFIRGVREKITPGTSALFAFTSSAVHGEVTAQFRDTAAHLIQANLSDEQEARLRAAFARGPDEVEEDVLTR